MSQKDEKRLALIDQSIASLEESLAKLKEYRRTIGGEGLKDCDTCRWVCRIEAAEPCRSCGTTCELSNWEKAT